MSSQPHKEHAADSADWQKLEGQVRQRWSELSDDDFQEAGQSVQQLIGVIQRKTGEAREQISSYLSEVADEIGPRVECVREAATRYSKDAADGIQRQYERAADRIKERYAEVQSSVRRKPTQSIAVAFGAGLVAGFVMSAALRIRGR